MRDAAENAESMLDNESRTGLGRPPSADAPSHLRSVNSQPMTPSDSFVASRMFKIGGNVARSGRETQATRSDQKHAGALESRFAPSIAHSPTMDRSAMDQLQKVLSMHRDHLRDALARPDRLISGIHGQIAVQLRTLLCDAECPVLVRYADEKMINVYVYGPVQYREGLRKHMVVHANDQVIGREPFMGSQAYDLRSYLDATIQVVPVRAFRDAKPGDDVTPRKLIKWVANKDGFAHFDFDKPKAFESFKTWTRYDGVAVIEEFAVKENLFQLGTWAADVIAAVLRAPPGTNLF